MTPWTRAESGTEHGEQSALFMWCNMAAKFGVSIANDPKSYEVKEWAKLRFNSEMPSGLPVLRRLYAIKNQEKGGAARGSAAKAEGVKAGVPDVFLPVPMAVPNPDKRITLAGIIQCGLYIELKRIKSARGAAGKTSPEQEDWIEYLTGAGYACEVCIGWEAARDVILNYLGVAQ